VLVEMSDDGAGFDAAGCAGAPSTWAALGGEGGGADRAAELRAGFPARALHRAEATDLSGRGVGLDAVKAAVEALGGKIGLRSAPGKGSRFTLELPLSVSMATCSWCRWAARCTAAP